MTDLRSTPSLLTAAEAAAAELTRGTPDYRIVTSWLSRHVAALEHAVIPTARRALPAGDVEPVAEGTRRLEHVLLQLHQALSGDGRGAVEAPVVARRLAALVEEHLSAARLLSSALTAVLSDQAWSALVARHDQALCNAPSRPHPHTPHGSIGERFSLTIAGAVDRLLDALDSRVVPPLPAQQAEISAPNRA
jgi:hypothetical protein